MEYQVILIGNGKYIRRFCKYKTKEFAYETYNELKEDTLNVQFPKRFINDGKIKSVNYELFLVKDPEDDDKPRLLRDNMGKLYEEPLLLDKWRPLQSTPFQIEEEFWLYGHESKKNRKKIYDLIKLLFTNPNYKNVRQAIVVHNKLVIHNEERFDMVICKNKEDAQRLHHKLHDISKDIKNNDIIFMGTCADPNIGIMYQVIHEHTKWPLTKIRRTTTKP
jgi:hypothetical protein